MDELFEYVKRNLEKPEAWKKLEATLFDADRVEPHHLQKINELAAQYHERLVEEFDKHKDAYNAVMDLLQSAQIQAADLVERKKRTIFKVDLPYLERLHTNLILMKKRIADVYYEKLEKNQAF